MILIQTICFLAFLSVTYILIDSVIDRIENKEKRLTLFLYLLAATYIVDGYPDIAWATYNVCLSAGTLIRIFVDLERRYGRSCVVPDETWLTVKNIYRDLVMDRESESNVRKYLENLIVLVQLVVVSHLMSEFLVQVW